MRLIDADELLLNNTWLWYDENGNHTIAGEAIEDAPTVDPIKHGHWIVNDNHHTCRCSCCENVELSDWALEQAKHCPNCGAKMDERET